MSSEQDKIQNNAADVMQNFGPASGLPHFGYNAASIAYLDTFIENQGESFRASPEGGNKLVSLFGSFLGEAIIANYGGEWQIHEKGIQLVIRTPKQHHFLNPFEKVYKRLHNGPEDSLHAYFAGLIPHVLAADGVERKHPPTEKKPWWKVFG